MTLREEFLIFILKKSIEFFLTFNFLTPQHHPQEGDTVKRTQRIASIRVGEGVVGRVLNTLGQPIANRYN